MQAWFNSGTIPANVGFEKAVSLPHITHIKAWMDDDSMRPEHLERLRQAYAISDQIAYAYTCAYSTGGVVYPRHRYDHNGEPNSFISHLPQPRNTVMASISWSIKWLGFLRFRLDFEQIELRKKWEIYPKRATRIEKIVLANDAFSYLEVARHIKQFQSVLDTKPTVDYLDHKQRALLVKQWYQQ
jgi:hypothetical protein